MTNFNRETVKSLRYSMMKEMEEVARKYGMVADFGRITFDPTSFRCRMEIKNESTIVTPPSTKTVGTIKVNDYIKHPARKASMRIVEITPSNSVIVETQRGTRYHIKMAEAIKYAI